MTAGCRRHPMLTASAALVEFDGCNIWFDTPPSAKW